MPPSERKDCFSVQNDFKDDTSATAQQLLSRKKTVVFHGGGGKGRVLPAVLDLLYQYGLKKKPERVVGISAGCFMALALTLGFTEKEDLLRAFKKVPFDTFKQKTWKRTVRFFAKLIFLLLPKWLGYRFQKACDWAYYDSTGIREYVRKLIVSRVEVWKNLEAEADYYGYPESRRKDPTFAEVYEKFGVNLELHVSVAEEPRTKVYSFLTTPNEKVSLAFLASTSIPGVYPAIAMTSGKTAVDGGVTDSIADFEHIPREERLHIRLLDGSASELYHRKPRYKELFSFDKHIKRLFGLFCNFEYKNFPDSEKAVTIAVEVPVDMLHYQWSPSEQAKYDAFACEQTLEQLKKMVILEQDYQHRERLLSGGKLLYSCSSEETATELLFSLCYNPYVIHGQTRPRDEGWEVVCEVDKILYKNAIRMS